MTGLFVCPPHADNISQPDTSQTQSTADSHESSASDATSEAAASATASAGPTDQPSAFCEATSRQWMDANKRPGLLYALQLLRALVSHHEVSLVKLGPDLFLGSEWASTSSCRYSAPFGPLLLKMWVPEQDDMAGCIMQAEAWTRPAVPVTISDYHTDKLRRCSSNLVPKEHVQPSTGWGWSEAMHRPSRCSVNYFSIVTNGWDTSQDPGSYRHHAAERSSFRKISPELVFMLMMKLVSAGRCTGSCQGAQTAEPPPLTGRPCQCPTNWHGC